MAGFLRCFACPRARSRSADDAAVAELDFAHCCLEHVPNEVFAYERTLERLVLASNNIRDLPRQVFHCHELKELDVSDNDLRVIPLAISSLAQLVKLDVSKNVLAELPDTIKQLKQLTFLDASINLLRKIPEGCMQLVNITELYLNDTFLEFLPANFGRLVKLKVLELRENGLVTLPKSLARLTSLERLDLGQNELPELPEVIGSLTRLTELWIDGNRIRFIPEMIGNLTLLNHLECSFNHVESISEAIGNCTELVQLSLTTNDLKTLPTGLGDLTRLVTLRLDDNLLTSLPSTVGQLSQLEELLVNQNYLRELPPSIGLCRRLHTLNADENDLEFLPRELGSCIALRVLSVRDNRLTALPDELDHIADLAVINLTGNSVQHLPVSFMKLSKISAIWLSENQTKPLIQLNQDTDPESGRRVLTNFLLPQQRLPPPPPPQQQLDNYEDEMLSDRGSRKTHVKWAGQDDAAGEDRRAGGGSLRREPTPFPKEMRAMAKRAKDLRTAKGSDSSVNSSMYASPAAKEQRTKRGKEYVPRETRKPAAGEADRASNGSASLDTSSSPLIREARVTRPEDTGLADQHALDQHALERSMKEKLRQLEAIDQALQHDMAGEVNRPAGEFYGHSVRKPSDPLPRAPTASEASGAKPSRPPPYHIAAAMSKHAGSFNGTLNQSETDGRSAQIGSDAFDSSGVSDSASALSEISTAPSSLQTVIRAPVPVGARQFPAAAGPSQAEEAHATHLRRVSEQLLANPRTRQSLTGIPALPSRPGSVAASPRGSALDSTVVSRPPASSSSSPSTVFSPPHVANGRRPGSVSSPLHTVGLPQASSSPIFAAGSMSGGSTRSSLRSISGDAMRLISASPLAANSVAVATAAQPKKSNGNGLTVSDSSNDSGGSNDLLSTIERAVHSDDECGPPPPLVTPKVASGLHSNHEEDYVQPNYENFSARTKISAWGEVGEDRISTSQFVANSKDPLEGSVPLAQRSSRIPRTISASNDRKLNV